MTRPGQIPLFFLYNDALEDVDLDFLHLEAIPVRSSRNDLTIRPHSHPEHAQFLLVTNGGGHIRVEDGHWGLAPPTLMVIPPAAVHEINFAPHTDGQVITAAASFVREAVGTDEALAQVVAAPGHYTPAASPGDWDGLLDAFSWIDREFGRSAPGRRTAITAHFQRILVALARLRDRGDLAQAALTRPDADIVARYRGLIEARFRAPPQLTAFADDLHVTYARLNAACRAVTGKSALKLLHERQMIEAKRNLLYTRMSIAEVGHAVGFQDPAYFNRFFTRHAGRSPGAFRAQPR